MSDTLHTRVHNKIHDMLTAVEPEQLSYDNRTGKATVFGGHRKATPVVVEIGPTSSQWSDSGNLRRGAIRDRSSWEWFAQVAFTGPVDTTSYEDAISQENTVAMDAANDLEGFSVELLTCNIALPPNQDPDEGATLDLSFNVRTARN